MPTTSAARRIRPTPRLLTVADVAVLPEQLPSGPVRFELDDGKLVVMGAHDYAHSTTHSTLMAELLLQGERRGLGQARGTVGIILRRDPDRVVAPDASFIANASLPLRLSPEDYLETIPEVVVEVLSRNDVRADAIKKVREYMKAGVRVVWAADTCAKTLTAYRRGRKPKTFREGDVLTEEGVLPGFHVSVRKLFQD